MSDSPFEGWAILELMGHRRLAGHVSEQTIAGAAFLRIDIPNGCTGFTAKWCPNHGDCTCFPDDPKSTCLLHDVDSEHGEVDVTQLYAPAAVYAITPTTEQTARDVAASINRVEPVHTWEMRQEPKRLPVSVDVEHDEF